MKKQEFTKLVNEGIGRGKNFMVVKVETEGNPAPEIIINSAENFDQKLRYYDKAYTDNMELIGTDKTIQIVDVLMTSNLNDLSWFAY